MKIERQDKILSIIAEQDIETQEQLMLALNRAGFRTTQATISRDIKELRIMKEMNAHGAFRYAKASSHAEPAFSARLEKIFSECVTKFDYAQNIVVIKTLPGLASAACSAIDAMHLAHVVGSLAGDDTALIIMNDAASSAAFCSEIKSLVRR